jgi:hypothetical protein
MFSLLNQWTAKITGFQCDRCLSRQVECQLEDTGACKRCREAKVACSMMPRHGSGKANRKALTRKEVYEYRLQQVVEREKSGAGKKGKGLAHKHREDPEPEASGSGPSPSTTLGPLLGMNLASGSSQGDSPAPEPTTASRSRPSLSTPSFAVVVPPVPRIMVPDFQQPRQPSPSIVSQSSDDIRNRTLADRVAALEDRFEKWRKEDARWKKEVNRKLKDSGM